MIITENYHNFFDLANISDKKAKNDQIISNLDTDRHIIPMFVTN